MATSEPGQFGRRLHIPPNPRRRTEVQLDNWQVNAEAYAATTRLRIVPMPCTSHSTMSPG